MGDSNALKADWDESYLYLRLATDDIDRQAFYVPIDTLAGEGSRQFQDATFAREADFVLLLDGKDNTRLLVDPYYNPNYRLYGLQIFTGEELKDFDIKGSGQFIPVKQVISNLMHMPKTGQTVLVQLWDTGKMRYGVSNPSSPDYDSMADFCAGKGFVEIRIPWMLLNFADPSSGKILSNLHTDLPFTFERILSIHMGVGKVGDPAEITMAPYTLPTWGAFPYQQRLKLAYYTLQKAFPEVAMYPISAGEQLTDALRLRNTRLLYVRIDRQIRNTDLITFFLLLIISGAFGAFRKDAVVSVGGYTTHCIGEDMELVVKLHRGLRNAGKPYKIDFLPDPICWTQPPENLRDLYKQRKRWQIGLINVLMRHRDMAFNRKYGKTGLLMLPYYWIFEFIGPIFETMSYFVIPLSWWLGIISWKFTLLFFLLVVMVGLILSLGAILQESYAMRKFPKMSQILTLAAYALIDNFGFRQFNTVIRFIGCLKYRSGKSTWGSMKREKFETKKK